MTRDPFDPLDGRVDDTLDLHGFRGDEVEAAVVAFIQRARRRDARALLHVITGRGRGSPGMPVVKTRVRTLLRRGLPDVAAWREDDDGGGFLVRLG